MSNFSIGIHILFENCHQYDEYVPIFRIRFHIIIIQFGRHKNEKFASQSDPDMQFVETAFDLIMKFEMGTHLGVSVCDM